MQCDYGHDIIEGKFDPITVPLTDEAGNPVGDENGEILKMTLRLPRHKARYPGNEAEPDGVMPNADPKPSRWGADPRGTITSEFDPAGMVMVLCNHGLEEHPNGRAKYPPSGRTWVRSKYATLDFFCIVDRTGETPDDLTTPR